MLGTGESEVKCETAAMTVVLTLHSEIASDRREVK